MNNLTGFHSSFPHCYQKSLPAVRHLTADPELFIQQASTSAHSSNTLSHTMKQSITDTGQNVKTSQQVKENTQGQKLCLHALKALITIMFILTMHQMTM